VVDIKNIATNNTQSTQNTWHYVTAINHFGIGSVVVVE